MLLGVVRIGLTLVLIGAIPAAAFPQSNNFFSNTQSLGLLAGSPSGCPSGATCISGGPGFNPTDLVNHADPNSIISGTSKIVGGVFPFFSRLGPGAITNNMFGVISQVNPGADGLFNNADDNSTLCGIPPNPFVVGVSPTSVGTNNSSLDCGNLRFNPTSQGMSDLTSSSDITGTTLFTFNADFSPSTDAHVGFDLFSKQVTALTSGGTAATVGTPGTFDAPGSGDQVVQFIPAGLLTTFTIDDIDPLTPTISPFPSNQADIANTLGILATDYNGGGAPTSFPQSTMPLPCWWGGCALSAENLTVP